MNNGQGAHLRYQDYLGQTGQLGATSSGVTQHEVSGSERIADLVQRIEALAGSESLDQRSVSRALDALTDAVIGLETAVRVYEMPSTATSCPVCGEVFRRPESVQTHVRNAHTPKRRS